jgi:membrane protease subunit HflK
MERNHLKIGLVNWLALLAGAVVCLAIARYVKSAAGMVATVPLLIGTLVALVSWFQMRLEERERLERLEFDELNKEKGSSALFNTDEADTFAARQSRESFEKYFVRGFTLLLLLGEIAAVVVLWRWLGSDPAQIVAEKAGVGMAVMGMIALLFFLLGKYATGISRLKDERLVGPGGAYLLLGSVVAVAVIAGALAPVMGGYPQWDRYIARGLVVVIGLIGLETFITLVAEIYRPRVRGKAARLIYDSRFVGIVGQPDSLFRTAGQALDYQFGFKVSDTEFFQFLKRYFPALLLVQVVILFASTCVVFLQPGEEGLLESFGKRAASAGVLEPGAHFKLPWPIDSVRRFNTKEVHSLHVGFVPADDEGNAPILWNVAHYKEEFNLLVASREQVATNSTGGVAVPVSLITVSIPVQFQIRNVANWAYNYVDPASVLEKIATREVVHNLVSADLNEVMSTGREQAARELKTRIQAVADELNLGVDIVFVGLQDIHPPTKVAAAYQAVMGAKQTVEAMRFAAEGYAARTVPLAQAEGQKRINESEAYAFERIAGAQAIAARFTNQITAFAASPNVYPTREYLRIFAAATAGARKIIVATTNSHEIVQLNLEERLRSDLGDVYVAPTTREQNAAPKK